MLLCEELHLLQEPSCPPRPRPSRLHARMTSTAHKNHCVKTNTLMVPQPLSTFPRERRAAQGRFQGSGVAPGIETHLVQPTIAGRCRLHEPAAARARLGAATGHAQATRRHARRLLGVTAGVDVAGDSAALPAAGTARGALLPTWCSLLHPSTTTCARSQNVTRVAKSIICLTAVTKCMQARLDTTPAGR